MKIKAALAGFGAIARHGHLPWFLQNETVELAAVEEPTQQGRATAQALLPHVAVFSSIDDLLKTLSVTFIDITAQPAAHSELILKALAAGIDVFCKNPSLLT
jgi:predicted dehydrogenase